MTPRAAFAAQSRACAALGSPLTAQICALLGEGLAHDQGAVAQRVLEWPGDCGPGGDSVPLRLAGGLHALVLRGAAPALARAYQAGSVTLTPLLETIAAEQRFLMGWLDSPPQTNEVARAAAIIAAARFVAALCPLPMTVLELGASAGLNLNFHRYHLDPNGNIGEGDGSRVMLTPEWRGDVPTTEPQIAASEGVDLRPLDPARDGARLLAYCWADQPVRLNRLRAALAIAAQHRPRVAQGDAANWLETRLAQPDPGHLRLIFHTIAWQYFPKSGQARCQAAIDRAGMQTGPQDALAHFGMEADGERPGAGLRLTLWQGGQRRDWMLGRADFHGRWINWTPQETP